MPYDIVNESLYFITEFAFDTIYECHTEIKHVHYNNDY